LLNEGRTLSKAADWNHPAWEKLWLYHLHYFDDLNAHGAGERLAWHRALIARWVQENPPGQGVGWEPYPLSLRAVNWIKWALSGNELEPEWVHSLAVQARYLRRRLEYHLLGNHLFENLKALIFAGMFFEGPEAAGWLAKAKALLVRERAQQVLADGGHCERSPMYHALILEGVLDLIQLADLYPTVLGAPLRQHLAETAARMLGWLRAMSHPDGEIALFNDAAFGIAPKPGALQAYAQALGIELPKHLGALFIMQESGYLRLAQDHAVALLDVGEVGPDYLPGHAHADTLSFELALWGQRLIVDSGTSCYGIGPERLRQRSTAAHNTVEVNGQSSSEVWGGFRVARRARPLDLEVDASEQALRVSGAHDGYRRLPGKVTHRRVWQLSRSGLLVRDTLQGHFRSAVGRFHFHPDVEVVQQGQEGQIRLRSGQTVGWQSTGGTPRVVASTYHPEFGLTLPSLCLEVELSGPVCEVQFRWG
jgi:uncharacterized heparinase superfamily protein